MPQESLTGANFVGKQPVREGAITLHATDPTTGARLAPDFWEATPDEIDRAACKAEAAFETYASLPPDARAAFLRTAADQILALGERLLERAQAETGLPRARLEGERGRTLGQLRLFADVVAEGSWVEARLDPALPDRAPQPRPDLRRMLEPLGPVAVFGASNFPLAFSVAGGDTASALAAGCPVVVKAHPGHPGVCELVARALLAAAHATGMPDGVVSLLHGASPEVGQALVRHPLVKAVAFTGSLRAGRALHDAAALRPEPIPVYAEMGSANPVFVLPGALAERAAAIAEGLVASVTAGAGQFCTNPGLTVLLASEPADAFLAVLAERLAGAPAGTMVHAGIKTVYDAELQAVARLPGVTLAARAQAPGPHPATEARPALLRTEAGPFLRTPRLGDEIYGPVTLGVRCASRDELLALARSLHGHLTATLHATEADLAAQADLVAILRRKVGRLILNGYPTGVEVSPAMHHGGPYPATTEPRATSVGTAAIQRFARPVCYQGFPESVLPDELKAANPRGIWRLVDGQLTRLPL